MTFPSRSPKTFETFQVFSPGVEPLPLGCKGVARDGVWRKRTKIFRRNLCTNRRRLRGISCPRQPEKRMTTIGVTKFIDIFRGFRRLYLKNRQKTNFGE